MKSIIIKTTICDRKVSIKIHENEDYGKLKEIIRDTLTPIIGDQNWGRIVEIIRDTAIPHFC